MHTHWPMLFCIWWFDDCWWWCRQWCSRRQNIMWLIGSGGKQPAAVFIYLFSFVCLDCPVQWYIQNEWKKLCTISICPQNWNEMKFVVEDDLSLRMSHLSQISMCVLMSVCVCVCVGKYDTISTLMWYNCECNKSNHIWMHYPLASVFSLRPGMRNNVCICDDLMVLPKFYISNLPNGKCGTCELVLEKKEGN